MEQTDTVKDEEKYDLYRRPLETIRPSRYLLVDVQLRKVARERKDLSGPAY